MTLWNFCHHQVLTHFIAAYTNDICIHQNFKYNPSRYIVCLQTSLERFNKKDVLMQFGFVWKNLAKSILIKMDNVYMFRDRRILIYRSSTESRIFRIRMTGRKGTIRNLPKMLYDSNFTAELVIK